MASPRTSQRLAALVLLTILAWLGWNFQSPIEPDALTTNGQPINKPEAEPELPELPLSPERSDLFAALCHYGICDIKSRATITYGRVDIRAEESSLGKIPLMQDVGISFPAPNTLESHLDLTRLQNSRSQATVKVLPSPKPADASHLMFGVATNIHRLEESLPQFSHWAAGNGAHIVALIPDGSSAEVVDRTNVLARALDVNLTIVSGEGTPVDRYFRLTSLMYNYTTSSTKWASLIDDDTFFPSMNSLSALLAKYPSPETEPYYVGALSEDFNQLVNWGMMAYGGGGIFLSTALLSELQPHLASCTTLKDTGDARLAHCIFSHTTTKLSSEALVHQVDLWGDASGFYEALRPQPISVHHWKSWHRFDMVNISRVSSVCGNACIFQKYRFDDDYQLTNGFSIVKYSEGHERNATDIRMEKTFWDSEGKKEDMFLHSVAPLRPKDEKKIQYILEGSIVEHGFVRQFYVRRVNDIKEPTVDIVEIAWTKSRSSA